MRSGRKWVYDMTNIEKTLILAYAECDMNISKTARTTHYSRNGVVYQLNKIHKKYGLNPIVFYDLVELVDRAKGGD